MRRVNAKDFAAQFEVFASLARQEPISVTSGGTAVGVFLSPEEFAHLRQLEDAALAVQAQEAIERNDFLSADESMCWINARLQREGDTR